MESVNMDVQNHQASNGQVFEREGGEFILALLDVLEALVVVVDVEGRIVYFNRACEATTGYSFQEVKGKVIWDLLLVPQEVEGVKAVFQDVYAGFFPSQYENYWVAKNGGIFWIAWTNTAILGDGGEVKFVVATGINISGRKQAEDALQRSELKSQALLSVLPDLMFRISQKGVFLDYNAPSSDVLMLPPGEFMGKSIYDVLPTHLAEITMAKTQQALLSGQIQIYEFQVTPGSEHYYESRLVPCGPDEVLSIVRNITERKRAEQSLHRRDAILEAVSFAAGSFLKADTWEGVIFGILECFGMAAEVSRVSLYQNSVSGDGARLTSLVCEWVAASAAPQQDNPALQGMRLDWPGFEHLRDPLQRGEPVYGSLSDFEPAERAAFEQLVLDPGCASLCRVNLVGFIGFEECETERVWSGAEIDALKAAASILGSAILGTRAEKVRSATMRISEAAHAAQDLGELFKSIHAVVAELMFAQNFYIAMYDEESDLISFHTMWINSIFPPQKPGHGLTECFCTRKPLLASPGTFEEFSRGG
jgi:PAS domain S-box-containing protein